MERGNEGFCLVDPLFYDNPTTARDDDPDFDLGGGQLPPGWTRTALEDWLVCLPPVREFPDQGWKVHVSATIADAPRVLEIVWDQLVQRGVPFKYVRSAQLLLLANSKYADRGSSGKFITVYPADDHEFESVVGVLAAALQGCQGPYVLSDLRIGDGPVYVRYGGFVDRWCLAADGQLVPAVVDDRGELVPDRRGTTFQPPSWVSLPAFLQPHLAARAASTVADLPYRIERPLHFSNGGGVYAGVDTRTGRAVVLKEGRPHAGLDMDGLDAVTRLRAERDTLQRLAGLDVVPEVIDHFTLGGHEFLVLEHVDGQALSNTLVDRHPLALLGDDRGFAEYTTWALALQDRVERAVQALHERDVVIGDLHPHNILVRPDGRIVLIDLEIASRAADGRRPSLGDPAFAPGRGVTGFDLDRYALACLRLFLFMPLTELLMLDGGKAGELAAEIGRIFPVPPAWLAAAVQVITGPAGRPTGPAGRPAAASHRRWPEFGTEPVDWKPLREALADTIVGTATPHRDDRLFPGDARQFELGGLNLAHGAAGVLLALHATGAGVLAEHEQWLVERALAPRPGTRFGFYDGLHGIAYALDRLGRVDEAMGVLDIAVAELGDNWDRCGLDLFGGLAGIGLNLAHFAARTGESRLWGLTAEIAEYVADEVGEVDDVPTRSGGTLPRAGLMHGSSGPALLFLRLYERSGDPALLERAATALRQDLRRCISRDDGSLEVDEGYRTMPYLCDGSVGIGLVLEEFLRHRPEPEFRTAAAAIEIAARSEFYIEPGLFSGRAGMIAYLAGRPRRSAEDAERIAAHVGRLAWHAVDLDGGPAFPGSQLLRLSMDLATGTAGVLFALGAALHDEPPRLPLFGPAPVDRPDALERG